MNTEKFRIYDMLWEAGFKGDVIYKLNWNLGKQLTYANDQQIQWAIVIGEDEVKNGVAKLKNLSDKSEETVNIIELVQVLK